MSIAVQHRRGTATEHGSFSGTEGEITYDTTNKRLVAHDGSTAGGIPLAKLAEVLDKATYDSDLDGKVNAAETADNSVAVDGVEVDLTGVADGFILYYDATSNKIMSKQDSGGGGGGLTIGEYITNSGTALITTLLDSGYTSAF